MPLDLVSLGKRTLNSPGFASAASKVGSRAITATHKIAADKEPQHAYCWEFLMTGIFGVDDDIQFYAKRAAVPSVTHETIKKRYAGKEYTFSGRDTSPNIITVQFWDNQDLEIYRFFSKWMNHMNNYHLNAKVSPINYQKQVVLRLKDTTDGIITEEFSFENCYPHELGEIELDYTTSAEASFDVNFTFDNMKIGYGVVDLAGDVGEIIGGARSLAKPAASFINSAASGIRSLF